MSCLLWENEFYENGITIADRIVELSRMVSADKVGQIAIEARTQMNIRHAPLLLVSALAQQDQLDSDLVPQVVNRADELSELLSIHCSLNGVTPGEVKKSLSHKLRKGLAAAFAKFDEYQLAKYNRDRAIKLRDVLRLTHPKPASKEQSDLWKRLNNDELQVPDTWEVGISQETHLFIEERLDMSRDQWAALDPGERARLKEKHHIASEVQKRVFEKQLASGRMGYLALLRNLRNMVNAQVDHKLIREAILARKGASKVLPFRFVAAVRAAPIFANELNIALLASMCEQPKLSGQTLVLVDVSYSMVDPLSGKSDMNRMDVAAALGAIFPGEVVRVMTFSENLVEVPAYQGLPGIDHIIYSQRHSGTDLGGAIAHVNQAIPHDRLVVITDEQSQTRVPDPVADKAYMINVASNRRGVGYGKWTHIDGFSEAVIKFIQELENEKQ